MVSRSAFLETEGCIGGYTRLFCGRRFDLQRGASGLRCGLPATRQIVKSAALCGRRFDLKKGASGLKCGLLATRQSCLPNAGAAHTGGI